MSIFLEKYVSWVRSNEASATALERMSRMLCLFVANPESLVSMEAAWTVAKVHTLSNRVIISTDSKPLTATETLMWLLQLFDETECLGEIALRHNRTHRAAWLFVVSLQLIKMVFRAVIHRARHAKSVSVIRAFIGALFSKSSLPSDSHGGRPAPMTGLIIPKVVMSSASSLSPTSNGQRNNTTWSDVVACIIDMYLDLRPVALAVSACVSFPKNRLGKKAIFMQETQSTTSVHNVKLSLTPEWAPWRAFAALDIVSLIGAHLVRRYRVPTVAADCDQAPANCEGVTSIESEDDLRISAIHRTLLYSIFRDPFFAVVLKTSVIKHFVEGRLNRWVPLLGPLIANQVSYMLSMQQHSFLYTVQ